MSVADRHPEAAYAFRHRLAGPHSTNRRDPEAVARPGEVVIDPTWTIALLPDSAPLVRHAAEDLRDYFAVSMDLPLMITTTEDPTAAAAKTIRVLVSDHPHQPMDGYIVVAEAGQVVVQGGTERATAQGCYFVEDLLNLRGGPYLSAHRWSRAPVFATRMTHSGWGLDEFPDGHLSQIAHAGFTSIVVFVTGPDHTPDARTHRRPDLRSPGRYSDLNALVDRCGAVGLDVYLYAYFHAEVPVHPDDEGAEAFFDRTYGALFRSCPRANGIILVGESVEFRSRDPKTSGRLRLDADPGAVPSGKPLPGWWPCTDYPAWVARVRDACRRYNPNAEIVFWTYNWGWAPRTERLELINALPSDVTVQATFEMFDTIQHDGVTNACVDYTAASVGPGPYFASEAESAHARDLAIFAMANTGGLTWDFGVIGFQPIPFRWAERHAALVRANEEWGVSGLMENHHYGWHPSFVSELAKWSYWTDAPPAATTIAAIARRDFGEGADHAVAAWRRWSDAAADYVPTNADQYGPFRIGPAYPLTLFTVPRPAVSDDAMFGDLILNIPYSPDQTNTVPTTASARRVLGEIASLERMLAAWEDGCALLHAGSALAPAHRRADTDRLENLGAFVARCVRTTLNVKRWWRLRSELLITADPERADELLNGLVEVGEQEHVNAEAAIPLVEADSRLGWEPSMDYLGDAAHIGWKLAHLRHALDHEIPAYRTSLRI